MSLALAIIFSLLLWPPVDASKWSFECQNGATYDAVFDRCLCGPHHHGLACESAFAVDNPCTRADQLPVIADPHGRHRPGAGNEADDANRRRYPLPGNSTDFSSRKAGWYRILSPWGNWLTEGCHSNGVQDADCGGRAAYVLHDLAREEGSPFALFRALAYPVWRGAPGCRLVDETFYPVRLLRCSEQHLTLFFLLPLPERHSYCIGGDESRKSTIVESMKAPVLKMVRGSSKSVQFQCNVSGAQGKNGWSIFTVKFFLAYKNGSSIEISTCRQERQRLPSGIHEKFGCPWADFVPERSNIYGSNLYCAVDSLGDTIISNLHSFTFSYNFSDGKDFVRPNETTRLCIHSGNIPAQGKLTFSLSIFRRVLVQRDHTHIAVLRSDKNGSRSCEVRTSDIRERPEVCLNLVLYNSDIEGKWVFGMSKGEQISEAKISLFYSSTADGLMTYSQDHFSRKAEKFAELSLKVDFSMQQPMQSGVQGYLHIFSDPYVKPVGGTYEVGSVYELKLADKGQEVSYTAMRHKLLPYEVQVFLSRPIQGGDLPDSTVTTRVAVRYGNSVITIYGNKLENDGDLMYKCKMLHAKSNRSATLTDCKRGLDIQSTGEVVRIRFRFYGTIIYVWKFRTSHERECTHTFVMTQLEMNSLKCRGGTHLYGANDEFVLDVMVIPGPFDTEPNVDGLMYIRAANETDKAINADATKSMFTAAYKMESPLRKRDVLTKEYYYIEEALEICTCDAEKYHTEPGKGRCFVDVKDVQRNRRQRRSEHVNHKKPDVQTNFTDESSELHRMTIFALEAKEFCSNFLSLRMMDHNYSISVCTNLTGLSATGTDYAIQFEFLCVRYAITLGSYHLTDTLFEAMLDQCFTEVGYNATVVRSESATLTEMEHEMCPDECSGNGVCMTGVCRCKVGFSGRACENLTESLEVLPTMVSMPRQSYLCASSDCFSTLLLVSPLLKTKTATCRLREVSRIDANLSDPHQWMVPAAHASGNLMICSLTQLYTWLRDRKRLGVVVQISLVSDSWQSSNTVERLVYQSNCSGRPTKCDRQLWEGDTNINRSCTIGQLGQRSLNESGGDEIILISSQCLNYDLGAELEVQKGQRLVIVVTLAVVILQLIIVTTILIFVFRIRYTCSLAIVRLKSGGKIYTDIGSKQAPHEHVARVPSASTKPRGATSMWKGIETERLHCLL